MALRANEYLKAFQDSLKEWTDHRFVSSQEIEDLAMFGLYLVNLGDAAGWSYDGHSWKESSYLGCLVVKVTRDGIPQVAFTSAKTYTSGVHIFLRKLQAGVLDWRKDRYRG